MIGCINKMMRILCCGMLPLAAVVCFILVMIQQCASQGYDDYDDYDECTLSTNPCDRSTSLCYNDGGEYECRCKSGYTGETTTGEEATCNDNNECSSSTTNQCDTSTSDCLNIDGSYQCKCRIGYSGQTTRGFGATCRDINECSMSTHHCTAVTSRCSNTVGSYRCICNRGYIGITTTGRTAACNKDVTAPRVRCPSSQFVTISINDQSGIVTWPDPTVTDNSGDSTTFVSVTQQSGSPFPPGETSITYVYEDFNGNEGSCTFSVTVLTDCTALDSNPSCNDAECSCVFEECEESLMSVCRGQCETFGCPANIIIGSGSQVNPGYPVDMKCSLLGPSSVVINMQLKLSKSDSTLNEEGIDVQSSEYTTGKQEHMFTVTKVVENEQLFCLLSYKSFVIGSVKATRFVFALPRLSSPPSPLTKGYTSLTIMWQEWNEQNDAGDPPIVAYKPYYKNDTSDQWIAGSSVATNQSLEYTVLELEQDTNYTFSVAAVRDGAGGLGPRGPPVTVKTLCNNSHITPEVTSTVLTENNRVNISWELPVDIECSTGIVTFIVYYEKAGSNEQIPAGTTSNNWLVIEDGLLEPSTKYTFYVTVTSDEESGYSRLTDTSQITTGKPSGGGPPIPVIAACSAAFVAALIILVLLVVFIRRRRREPKTKQRVAAPPAVDDPDGRARPADRIYDDAPTRDDGEDNVVQIDEEEDRVRYIPDPTPDKAYGNVNLTGPQPVRVDEFADYVRQNWKRLEQEFLTLEGKEPQHPWEVAVRPANHSKNRFKNMYTYDHSRVVLKRVAGDNNSDYYNASFISNHRGERAFIASQAPNKASLDTFWRMIWEQKVYTIVMVTKLFEDGKDRCSMYWPKKLGESVRFDFINVIWTATRKFADFEVRTFSVVRAAKTRDVVQLHFTGWPDKDIPEHRTPLIEFARVAKQVHRDKETPLLVHCSAGIGRTGTFLALYEMMDVLTTEEYIDIFGFVTRMRENRINMIQTMLQYSFMHHCLYEFHLTHHCEMPFGQLGLIDIESNGDIAGQFELISMLSRGMPKSETKVEKEDDMEVDEPEGKREENVPRNRFGNMIPDNRNRVFMKSTSPNNPENYINASFVKSLEKKDAFITAQAPLPNTIEDFWRMIYDHDCRIVVMLNQLDLSDKMCPQYWPDRGNQQYGIMRVNCVAVERFPYYMKRSIEVSYGKRRQVMAVTHVQLDQWPPESSLTALVEVIKDVQVIQHARRITTPVVVHCMNGFDRCGVFVAVTSEMERIRTTKHVNVFSTVKKLRDTHEHILRKRDDFILCFLLLREFVNVTGNYENWE